MLASETAFNDSVAVKNHEAGSSLQSCNRTKYYYDVNGALRGVWNETNGTWKQLEIGLGSASLETYNWTPPSGYSNFTYTGTSLLGSTAFRYNPGSGGIAKNYHFLPYGLEWPGESSDATSNLKWTGHEKDSESGLYHFLFRNYAPLENRWLSPDPAGWIFGDPGAPGTWNRYTYAGGSPCSATDPLGLADCPKNSVPLSPAQADAVIASALRIVGHRPPLKYGRSGAPGTIDCTRFIHAAILGAGLDIPLASTSAIYNHSDNGVFFIPDSTPGRQKGDVVLLDAGAGPHSHAVLLGNTPGTFYASNSSTGPALVDTNKKTWWKPRLAHGRAYRPCVPKTSQRPKTSGPGDDGPGVPHDSGGPDNGTSIWKLYWQWLLLPPEGRSTTVFLPLSQ